MGRRREETDDDAIAGSKPAGGLSRPLGFAHEDDSRSVLSAGTADVLLRSGRQDGLLRRRGRRELRMQVAAFSAPTSPPPTRVADVPWLEFRGRLRAFVSRRVDNSADADDIVQWVLLKLHRSLDRIHSTDRIHAWLYRTARRAIADYYRSGARRREVPAGGTLELELLTASPTSEPADDAAQVAACLAPMVEKLSGPDREAIVLTELKGHRLADLAATSGLSISGAKSRVQRARQRLRRMLLECCHVALDARGTPMGCSTREPEPGPSCDGTK
jgi:RNA polymerase sigma-70 factor (ECF subfamily)